MQEDNRITLQYSVEESQLKFEVHRLVLNALNRLSSIRCDEPDPNTTLSMSTVDEIRALRIELGKIDILLSDAGTIIENYVDYKHQQRVNQAMNVESSTNEMPSIDNLQDKLQNFKEKLSVHENSD